MATNCVHRLRKRARENSCGLGQLSAGIRKRSGAIKQTTRAPFPGNIIPQSRFNAAGAGLLSFYPNPNYVSPVAGVLTNYLVNLPSTQNSNSFDVKGDMNLTSQDVVSAHVSQRHLTLD